MFPRNLAVPVWRQFCSRTCLLKARPCVQSLPCTSVTQRRHCLKMSTNIRDNLHDRPSVQGNLFEVLKEREIALQTSSLDYLESAAAEDLPVREIAMILERLCQLQKQGEFNADRLWSSENFGNMLKGLQDSLPLLPDSLLLRCLRSLLELSKEDTHVIKALINQLVFLNRRVPIFEVIKLIDVIQDHQNTLWRRNLYAEMVKHVSKRWVEISEPIDIVKLMKQLMENDLDGMMGKVESRALDIVDHFEVTQLCQMLYILSLLSHRHVPLIHAIIGRLKEEEVTLHLGQIKNIMFACCKLFIFDVELLDKLSNQAVSVLSSLISEQSVIPQLWNLEVTVKAVMSILISSGLTRWNDEQLGNSIVTFLGNNFRYLFQRDKISFVFSVAKLNFQTDLTKALVGNILLEDFSEALKESPLQYLDFVWSLAVLEMLDSEKASTVLDRSFISSLHTGESDFQKEMTDIKLANISTAATHEVKGYSGPTFHLDISSSQKSFKPFIRNEKQVQQFLKMCPDMRSEEIVKTKIVTPSGYFVDAELYVNEKGEPVQYDAAASMPNVHRICLKVLGFFELNLKGNTPTGLQVMSSRHLNLLGYKVVQIYRAELLKCKTTVEKAQYVQTKIKEAVSADRTSKC